MSSSAPHVIVIGTMKSATSTLSRLLANHPQVCFSDPKEPDVLSRASSPEEAHKQYEKLFRGKKGYTVRAEGSVAYTRFGRCGSSDTLAKAVCGPDLKLIVAFRDPVQRLESHIRHELIGGRLSIDEVSDRLRSDPQFIETSRYDERLRPWVEQFGVGQLLPIRFSDIEERPEAVSTRVFQFLNLPQVQTTPIDPRYYNTSAKRPQVGALWRPLARSSVYRRFIRPRIPKQAISRAVSLISKTQEGSAFTLNEEDRRWASRELRDVDTRLRELLCNPDLQLWEAEDDVGRQSRNR